MRPVRRRSSASSTIPAQPLVESLAEILGRTPASQLVEATTAATERLRVENAALINAIASRTAETITAVQAAKAGLTDDVSNLIDRLSASNAKLGELIDMATKNLGDIDGRLLDTTTTFAENATKAAELFQTSTRLIDGNLGKLSQLSNSTLTDIAAIAKTLRRPWQHAEFGV